MFFCELSFQFFSGNAIENSQTFAFQKINRYADQLSAQLSRCTVFNATKQVENLKVSLKKSKIEKTFWSFMLSLKSQNLQWGLSIKFWRSLLSFMNLCRRDTFFNPQQKYMARKLPLLRKKESYWVILGNFSSTSPLHSITQKTTATAESCFTQLFEGRKEHKRTSTFNGKNIARRNGFLKTVFILLY